MEKIYKLPPRAAGWRRNLVFADQHLLHPRVPTAHLTNLTQDRIIEAGELATIWIAGDLWDDSKYLRTEDSKVAMGFLVWLLTYCKAYGIALRVVEGTPSHDHGQSAILLELNKNIGADVLYLPKIGVMYDAALGGVVGWVQDEFMTDASETERMMNELMISNGYDKLDFCFMHGMFKFQSPVENPRYFSMDFWLARVRHLIYIGHDHRPKQYDRIRVPGSPDRYSHGEEEEKGYSVFDFDGKQTRDYFWVNEYAVPQYTVRVTEAYDDCLAQCRKRIEDITNHPSGLLGRLKIEYSDGSPIVNNVAEWKRTYPFKIELVKVTEEQPEDELIEQFDQEEDEEPITPDNVERIMLEAVAHLRLKPELVSSIVGSLR